MLCEVDSWGLSAMMDEEINAAISSPLSFSLLSLSPLPSPAFPFRCEDVREKKKKNINIYSTHWKKQREVSA